MLTEHSSFLTLIMWSTWCVWVFSTDILSTYQNITICICTILEATLKIGARGSLVSWGTVLQAGRSWVGVPMRWIFFFFSPPIYLIHPASLWPWGRLILSEMSTRNLPGVGRANRSWRVRLTTLAPSVSQMSTANEGALRSLNPMGHHNLLQEQLYIFFALKIKVFFCLFLAKHQPFILFLVFTFFLFYECAKCQRTTFL
jgi:hypothetical protein